MPLEVHIKFCCKGNVDYYVFLFIYFLSPKTSHSFGMLINHATFTFGFSVAYILKKYSQCIFEIILLCALRSVEVFACSLTL